MMFHVTFHVGRDMVHVVRKVWLRYTPRKRSQRRFDMFEVQTRKNKAYRTVEAFRSFDAAAFYLSRHVGTDVDRRIITRNGDKKLRTLVERLAPQVP